MCLCLIHVSDTDTRKILYKIMCLCLIHISDTDTRRTLYDTHRTHIDKMSNSKKNYWIFYNCNIILTQF